MQLLYEVDAVLRAAEFRTVRPAETPDTVVFEDDTILGFVAVYAGVEELITQWKNQQDGFLRGNAARLRRDPSKAWNTYSVFLTAAPVDQSAWETLGIESDMTATRKIVRGGIITVHDVRDALGPILPLVAGRTTSGERVDALLKEKLTRDEAVLFDLVRDQTADEHRVANWAVETAP